jgi:uncharacterized protein YyaL (SSP411 family)
MIQSEINALGHLMPNRLSKESSPYLQQHSDNPVDWYPWGSEALDRARAEDKPILLSIGYAACHWCHVMAHESFEDEKTAQVMNEKFINIKVDREERPDIDAIYMQAVQALTGHGGWPMTMFLLPDGSPFYGGTYYPPEDRQGLPSFRKILNAVADAYVKKRGDISKTSEQIKQIYKAAEQRAQSAGALSAHTLELAYRGLAQQYDGRNGGFGGAPKFPSTMCLDFLLRYSKRTGTGYAQEMALESFRKMARGGIYDQVGGGFHRYAVDAIWLVPHFEKMLYDNALLTRVGAHLWQATHDAEVRRVTEETVEWVAREMTSPAGGFYSSLDADSEGHEGKFYVWDDSELNQILGDDSTLVKQFFGVTQAGNFEGKNILFRLNPASAVAARAGIAETEVDRIVGSARTKLYDERAKRVWPGRDEKVLAGWNGLMLRGVATAARAFGRTDFRELAIRNAGFLEREMVRDGRVMRSHKDGITTIPGFLEDQAAVALGFVSVYELTFDERWVQLAALIAEKMVEFFWDDSTGAFYDTARDAEKLITRPRDVTDNAIPSGNSLAIELLLHLSELTGDSEMKRRATFALETLGPTMISYPMAFGHALGAADMSVNGAIEVALSGSPGEKSFQILGSALGERYVPSLVLAGGESGKTALALLKDRPTLKQVATAYVCRGYVCDAPTDDRNVFGEQLGNAAKSR